MGLDYIDSINQQQQEQIEEIQKKIEKSYPSKNGLKIPEIMMLYYARTYTTNQKQFQAFWKYKYAVEKPELTLETLYKRGFICISSSNESLKNLKISELKEILKELGLKQSGNKADLVNRIVENTDERYIDKKISEKNYDLTDLGRQELLENEYVPYFHKVRCNYGLDVFEMNKIMHSQANKNFRDIIWGELNRQTQYAMKEISVGNYQPYIQNRNLMCDFLIEEKKNYEQALRLVAEATFYEINAYLPRCYKELLNANNFEIKDIYKVVTAQYEKISLELNFSDDELFKKLQEIFSEISFPEKILSNSDLSGLIIAEINEDKITSTKIYTQIKQSILEKNKKTDLLSSIKSFFKRKF